MKKLKPITTEYVRRFSILILLALFAWIFFYSPSDIYEIQVENYVSKYQSEIKNGSVDPSKVSLDEYIAFKMKGSYTWSKEKKKIVEVKGESEEFLNRIANINRDRGKSSDDMINKHRSPDTFWSGNSYFFRESELPEKFLSQTLLKHPDYLMTRDKDGEKRYFNLNKPGRSSSLDDAPVFLSYPLRIYSYLLLLLSIVFYIYLPRPKVPKGAAYYTRFNAVYLPDILGFSFWLGGWMFFFLPDDSAPMFARYFMLAFFGIFALAILLSTIKYASNWYFFTKDAFQWSDIDGVGEASLDDIVSVKPYKRQLPKWVGPLIILFGRGQPVATGVGTISMSSSPEVGMEITLKSGKKIKVIANYLKSDKEFTKKFQELVKRSKK